ncbi:MAG: STAS domain-containing protein [Ruminococcaceae bacterium]|nr:STAS domain-containing protein [Oscillospiraceae bacterium]
MKNIFRPKIIDSLKGYSGKMLVSDLVAGVIVAIIALPLSIALAIASGVPPVMGICTAIIAGFVISLLGGSRVNISGPTAAFATIVAGIVAQFGVQGLVLATFMAGILLVFMGLFRFGSLIKYIPITITTGFTSGVAVTIVIGQLKDFFGLTFAEGTHAVETTEKVVAAVRSFTTVNLWALLVGAVGLAVLIVWPMLGKVGKKIPGSLIAVIVGALLVMLLGHFGIEVATIGSTFGALKGSFDAFNFPKAIDLDLIFALLPSAFTIAVLAAIESLLSCVVSDGMIGDRHNSNTELIAQGLGNVCSGLFGGIPATGAIARTAANVKNGGRSPISGMVHAAVLFAVLFLLMPYASLIPMPIIAAILFMVAYNMSEWRSFVKLCRTAPVADIVVLVVTFVFTVVFDLVVAIAVGMVLAVVFFMKRMADNAKIRAWQRSEDGRFKHLPERVAVFEIDGPMFFASAEKFSDLPIEEDCRVLILRMHNVPALDATATKNLFSVQKICREKKISLLLAHVNDQPLSVMKRAGFVGEVGEENFLPNIDIALRRAEELCQGSSK